MQEIRIQYRPLIMNTTVHTRSYSVNSEQLNGILSMAYTIGHPASINIYRQDGTPIRLDQVPLAPYWGYRPDRFKYTAKFISNPVSFNSIEFIQGAMQVCLLFGFNPATIIIDIKQRDQPADVDFGRYFGALTLPNTTGYLDGIAVELDFLADTLSEIQIQSMFQTLQQCFSDSEPGTIVPSDLYVITADSDYNQFVALAEITSHLPDEVRQYDGAWYIFNVCSSPKVRGQGFAKSIMIMMLNDMYRKGVRQFILEVLPTNTTAYKLYTSLGFHKVGLVTEGDKTYDVLALP